MTPLWVSAWVKQAEFDLRLSRPAQPLSPWPNPNLYADWLADLAVSNASACTLPPAPRATPPPSCPPASRDLTPQELDELGYLLAPKIYLHQDEW